MFKMQFPLEDVHESPYENPVQEEFVAHMTAHAAAETTLLIGVCGRHVIKWNHTPGTQADTFMVNPATADALPYSHWGP